MRELGDDIMLLAIRPNGRLSDPAMLRIAVLSSQLVRLAALRRVEIADQRVTVRDPGPTGDPLLDAELASLAAAQRPPRAKTWVGKKRRGVVGAQMQQLTLVGTVRPEEYKALGLFKRTRWHVVDVSRVDQARARLDAVLSSTAPLSLEQFALGGIVNAVGLGRVLFPKSAGRPVRRQLAQAVRGESAAIAAGEDAVVKESVEAAVKGCVQAAKALREERASSG